MKDDFSSCKKMIKLCFFPAQLTAVVLRRRAICDFCGQTDTDCFNSTKDSLRDICENCVKQMYMEIKK